MACFSTRRNMPALINLIESSRGTKRRGLTVYAMQLIELSERSSSISMIQTVSRNKLSFWAFEAYQQLSSVSVHSITAISHLSSIHDNIIASALKKRVALIILPSHRMLYFDGSLESINHANHVVNQGVLNHAPCSVAIFVNRGFGGAAQVSAKDVTYSTRVLFFGGQDDREALAIASRMAEHPGISLTVTHFMVYNSPSVPQVSSEDKTADNMAIEAFKAMAGGENMDYQETVVNGHVELAAAIRAMGRGTDLFLVGRSPLMPEVLSEKQGCPELGVVGGYLTSEEFTAAASVLVIQCYDPIRDPYTKLYSVEGEPSVTATTCHDIEAELN